MLSCQSDYSPQSFAGCWSRLEGVRSPFVLPAVLSGTPFVLPVDGRRSDLEPESGSRIRRRQDAGTADCNSAANSLT